MPSTLVSENTLNFIFINKNRIYRIFRRSSKNKKSFYLNFVSFPFFVFLKKKNNNKASCFD